MGFGVCGFWLMFFLFYGDKGWRLVFKDGVYVLEWNKKKRDLEWIMYFGDDLEWTNDDDKNKGDDGHAWEEDVLINYHGVEQCEMTIITSHGYLIVGIKSNQESYFFESWRTNSVR